MDKSQNAIPLNEGKRLRRRLRWYQIFFISFGGLVGIGFFKGSSTTTAVSGPGGALISTIVVGLVAIMVMEAICELINIWPISNALVEYVRAFVDEDLGVAIGMLYWYTYCITFSALVIKVGELADYWTPNGTEMPYIWKGLLYAIIPWILAAINFLPVEYFGWIEFVGGVIKLALVIGTFVLMICINVGVGHDGYIGPEYFADAVQNNENVASNHATAVFTSIPNAIFAYIGVELLVTTAFEARDPSDLRFPSRNIGWISAIMYGLTTGVFVANVSWQDRQLPQLFLQALTTITEADAMERFPPIREDVHAAPLIALLRLGFHFLPGFLNACFIYSALSCANTALYVASRQLFGLTRSIDVDPDSGTIRRFGAWLSNVEPRSGSPWNAVAVSVLVLYWVPFIRRHETNFIIEIQDGLGIAGSVSCILVWCSQCVAYSLFFRWREIHELELRQRKNYANLFDMKNFGWFRVTQPYLSYVAAAATAAIVFFFNTVSMWNGDRHSLKLKALSAFVSPAVLLLMYLVKKFTRPRQQWRFFNNLRDWNEFEKRIERLNDLVYLHGASWARESELTEYKSTNAAINERIIPQRHSRESQHFDTFTRGDLMVQTDLAAVPLTAHDRSASVSPIRGRPQETVHDLAIEIASSSRDQLNDIYNEADTSYRDQALSPSPHGRNTLSPYDQYMRTNLRPRQLSNASAISERSEMDGHTSGPAAGSHDMTMGHESRYGDNRNAADDSTEVNGGPYTDRVDGSEPIRRYELASPPL